MCLCPWGHSCSPHGMSILCQGSLLRIFCCGAMRIHRKTSTRHVQEDDAKEWEDGSRAGVSPRAAPRAPGGRAASAWFSIDETA